MSEPAPPPAAEGHPSSLDSAAGAGWDRENGSWTWSDDETGYGKWTRTMPVDRPWPVFSWLSARALLDSVNDQVVKYIGDLVDPRRQRWIAAQRAIGQYADNVLTATGRAFFIVGDPGEIDASQFAVIEPLIQIDREQPTNFLVVLSDVIYPDGEVNLYVPGFYEAWDDYGRRRQPDRTPGKPIYGLPGNHDWYDGLNGFMWNFCGAEALPPTEYRTSSFTASERAARMLWRRAGRPDRPRLLAKRSPKAERWTANQPGPYWAMDVGRAVRLIAIDTGITGCIDREQGSWLLRMANDDPDNPLPKVLLTGKPLWVDGKYDPGESAWGTDELERPLRPPVDDMRTIDDIVRKPEHNFRAAIGGDIHNYQRLTLRVGRDGTPKRSIEYVVTGGGGAYLSDTQRIELGEPWFKRKEDRKKKLPSDITPPKEENFRCYPSRADSLAYFTRFYGKRIFFAWVAALGAALLAEGALLCWDAGGSEVGGQDVQEVGWVGVIGMFVAGISAVLVGLLAGVWGRGSRATAFLLLAPALFAGLALGGHALLDDEFDWIWKATLLGFGMLLMPVVMTVLIYYRFATPVRQRLGLALLLVVVAGLGFARFDDATSTVATVAGALVTVALLMLILERLADRQPNAPARDPLLSLPLVILLYHLPLAVALIRWEHAWALKAAFAVELALIVLLGAAVVLLVGLTARGALFGPMRRGRVDPDHLHAVLDAGNPARTGEADDGDAKQIVRFMMGDGWFTKKARLGLHQIGNADKPPLFKNFVRAEVSEDGKKLELVCYGVTGWARHEKIGQVPVEDRVEIELG